MKKRIHDWMNVYGGPDRKYRDTYPVAHGGNLHPTKEEADAAADDKQGVLGSTRIACIEIDCREGDGLALP